MALLDTGLSQKSADQLGLPQSFSVYSPFPFGGGQSPGGMNQQDDRAAMADTEFFVLENYMRVGGGYLRTLWDRGAALYTAPVGKNIVKFAWYNIGITSYVAVFLSDGTAVQVDTSGNVTTISSNSHTFYNGNGTTPGVAQWGSKYLIISSNIASNSYWIWDGSVLYESGGISPVININSGGSGYSSPPTATAHGGVGSGVTVTPVITNGAVTSLTVTNPGSGYEPGDVVQFAFSGGGSDSFPILTAVLAVNTVQSVTVLVGGSGYVSGNPVLFTGGGGTGAAATATVSGGSVIAIVMTSGGANYTSLPVVSIDSGHGAAGTATVSGNSVTTVVMSSGGFNYLSVPAVTFTGGGGSGAGGTATISGGAVTAVVMSSGGTGYTGIPAVGFIPTGIGFNGSASLTAGRVASVTVVSGGSGFTAVPSLSFVGGGGTGAAGTVVLSGGTIGHITSVTLQSGGGGYTAPPAVVVSAGQNNAASATASLMPFSINGYAVETFETRVWLANTHSATASVDNGGVIMTSAPGSLSDFATSDGGNMFVASEPFLRVAYTNLKQAQGYLYTTSDSACDVILNVQTSGNPSTTSFNYQNVDPQTGAAWRDTGAYYGLSILFANTQGVFGLYGGAVQPISSKLTRIFGDAVFPPTTGAVVPSAAVADIHTVKCYLINMTITDPATGLPRTVMLGWDQKGWFLASQTTELTFIGTNVDSSNYTAWGTDGKSLFPLFSAASPMLEKRFSTKLYGANSFPVVKQAIGLWMMASDRSTGKSGVNMVVTADTEGGSIPLPMSPLRFGGVPMLGTATGDIYGAEIGVTSRSTSPDFVLQHLAIGYVPYWGGYGDPPAVPG